VHLVCGSCRYHDYLPSDCRPIYNSGLISNLHTIRMPFTPQGWWSEAKTSPHEYPIGIVANELQMVHPESVRLISSKADAYLISSVTPTRINSGDVVTVQYYTSSPGPGDFIAVYGPAAKADDISSATPLKWGFCDDSAGYSLSGVGSLMFNMTNVRTDIRFVYFSNGTDAPIFQNISTEVVTFVDLNQPLRPRVIPSGDPDVYWLLWSSYNSTSPVMKWGLVSQQYDETAYATTSSINRSDLCGAPANSTGELLSCESLVTVVVCCYDLCLLRLCMCRLV
jgi:hypothetical protein